MLTITCIFDEELGPDGIDPLGKLMISNGDSEIAIDVTYLDSWLAGLIDGLQQLNTTNIVKVTTEEREPIEMDLASDGHLKISYKGKSVVAGGQRELELALRGAVSRFLDGLKDSPNASQNRGLDPILRFWTTTTN